MRSGFETPCTSRLRPSSPSPSSLMMFHLKPALTAPHGAPFTAGTLPPALHRLLSWLLLWYSQLPRGVHTLPSRVTWRVQRWLQHGLSSWLLDQNPPSQCIIAVRSPVWAEFIPMFPPRTVPWPTRQNINTSFLWSHLHQNRWDHHTAP